MIKRFFTKEGVEPLSDVRYKNREIKILNSDGEVIYHQPAAEFPEFWSDNACRIVASKYFDRGNNETSVKQMIERVVNRIYEFAVKDNYFTTEQEAKVFRDELAYMLVNQYGCFNSPVWFNLGAHEQEQTSACFVLELEDNIHSLLKCQVDEVLIAKNGSGSGVVNSKVRSRRDVMSRGGKPSGPLSFMKARDAWANIILSGGVLRRFAKMEILHYWHPDIYDFVDVKSQEEEKARKLGPEYHPWFQNSNFSVRLDDKFWQLYHEDGEVLCYDRTKTKVLFKYRAKELIRKIAEGTYHCGDPGLQFEDTMYKWITVSGDPTSIITNPCAEYIWYPNTSCNLASLNVMKFLDENGMIKHDALQHAVNVFTIAMDLFVHNSSYPTKEIKENTIRYRNLGLGFSNLGATLMRLCIPYHSLQAMEFAREFQMYLHYYALKNSVELAKQHGAAEGFDKEKTLQVFNMNLNMLKNHKLYEDWTSMMDDIAEHGLRNCQVTVIAPTGTISFMMDCETTGIEPVLFLRQIKNVVDGYKMEITIPSVEVALKRLGYDNVDKILEYVRKKGTLEGCSLVKEEHLPIFDTSFSAQDGGRCLPPEAHIEMCAAVQPFVSGGISKTVNLPHDISVDKIEKLYIMAYEKGLKCVSMYRDGSKVRQVLEKPKDSEKKSKSVVVESKRRRLPDTCISKRHKFTIDGHSGFLHYACYPDTKELGEIFITMSREGSTLGGLLDCFAASISIGLQYGVPLQEYIQKFINTRFVPSGFTSNKEIPRASSIVDYIFRYLEREFSNGKSAIDCTSEEKPKLDGVPCDYCGGITYVSGRCFVCSNCGETTSCG